MDSSLGGELADIALFMRVGDVFPRHGRRILMTRMYIHRTPTGAGNKAVTWAFGSPADLEEANRLLSQKFDTEPVTDPRGMAAIEIRHPEFAAGTAEPMVLLDASSRCWGPPVSRASPCVTTRAPLVPGADSLGRCAHYRRGLLRPPCHPL